jgi:hypothetical protein
MPMLNVALLVEGLHCMLKLKVRTCCVIVHSDQYA